MAKSSIWGYWAPVSFREWRSNDGRWRVVRDRGEGIPTYTVYEKAPCGKNPWRMFGMVFSLGEAINTTIRAQLLEVVLDGRAPTISSSPRRSRRWRLFR